MSCSPSHARTFAKIAGGQHQAGGAFVLREWGSANADTLLKYIQANVEGLRWAMNPANKAEAVAMLSERLKLPEDIATKSYEAAVDPQKGAR